MSRITRRLEIDAGHRLLKHEGKCHNIHGHRYVFEITVSADQLDEVGRVIDFAAVKELVGGWLDDQWDHGFLAQHGDPIISFIQNQKLKICVMKDPPTAENLARELYYSAQTLLPRSITLIGIRCYETPNCWADYP